MKSTIDFYNNNTYDLIEKYETVNMSTLHQTILKHLKKGSKVLDIGFGSGRDLAILKENDFDVWGADPSQNFLEHIQKRFPDIKNHFFNTSLPQINLPGELRHSFDAIILIAVWMHLPKSTYQSSIDTICSYLKPGGKIILSYNISPRVEEDERYFETIDREYLQNLFKQNGFTLVSESTDKDKLNQRDIDWVTEVYIYDKEIS